MRPLSLAWQSWWLCLSSRDLRIGPLLLSSMVVYNPTLQTLCQNKETLHEAHRILFAARAQIGPGSGDPTDLPAVCAYLASQNLKKTDASIQAAQMASSQSMVDFKSLRNQVAQALTAYKPSSHHPTRPLHKHKVLCSDADIGLSIPQTAKASAPAISSDTPNPPHPELLSPSTHGVLSSPFKLARNIEPTLDKNNKPPRQRRFRPVFLDQKQWAAGDPRLVKVLRASEEFHRRMVSMYGAPFQDFRN
ncbi:hypothetical protein C8R43DRAFT_964528 [Mycena crocata]|nr:hypothetical protein C8R43DRAFT_964528 [Mycena crocata]